MTTGDSPAPAVDLLELTATAMAVGGDAVARADDGRVVFVTGALPGERVRVAVTERKKDFWRADTVTVVEPSVDRVAPPCGAVALGCGGCGWQHVAVDAQRRLKREMVRESLQRIGRIADPVVREAHPLSTEGFRVTMRVAGGAGGRAGFRKLRSNDVVVPDRCLVAAPDVERQRSGLTGLGPDDEVQIRAGTEGTAAFAVAGRPWRVSPGSFFQARLDGADELVRLVLTAADAPTGAGPLVAVDLYSGVGLFAGVLAAQGWRVTAVESNRAAVDDARHNLAGLDVRVVRSDVARWRPHGADLVVADPGRPGLAKPGTAAVVATGAAVVVLVSCDAASLGRDSRLLADAGYRLEWSHLVDMFPHTPHVEVVSRFTLE